MARAQSRIRAAAVLVSAAAIVWLALPISNASAGARRTFSSINLARYADADPTDALRMSNGGVRTVRVAFTWFGVEAQRANFNWSQLDQLVGDLASQGIRVEPVLYGTPHWAVSERPSNPLHLPGYGGSATAYPPVLSERAFRGWRRFVRKAVERYGPDGSYWTAANTLGHPGLRALPITTWQVWNEPTIPESFWPKPNVGRYARLLKTTSKAIRNVDPHANVATAGVPGHIRYRGVKFIRQLYTHLPHASRYFNLLAFHPYAPGVRRVLQQLRQVRRVARRAGDPRVRLWVSETGWGSGNRDDSRLNKGRAGQARLLHKLFTRLAPERGRLRLWQVTWFDWRDPRQTSALCAWCVRAGLIDWRDRRKPAWNAYRSFMGIRR
jgi:Beta-galactosidase